jgi:hypothetical protein
MLDPTVINTCLRPLAEGLAADGYQLRLEIDANHLLLRISSGGDGCDDCLIPKAIMSKMVSQALEKGGIANSSVEIELFYPTDTPSP